MNTVRLLHVQFTNDICNKDFYDYWWKFGLVPLLGIESAILDPRKCPDLDLRFTEPLEREREQRNAQVQKVLCRVAACYTHIHKIRIIFVYWTAF